MALKSTGYFPYFEMSYWACSGDKPSKSVQKEIERVLNEYSEFCVYKILENEIEIVSIQQNIDKLPKYPNNEYIIKMIKKYNNELDKSNRILNMYTKFDEQIDKFLKNPIWEYDAILDLPCFRT